jgi:hypothetical protein
LEAKRDSPIIQVPLVQDCIPWIDRNSASHPGESEPGKPNIHRSDPGAGAASLSGTQ